MSILMFILWSYCKLLNFMWLLLTWIITSVHLGRNVYNSFTILTGMGCNSLWLSSHDSSRLCGFFWQTLLFSSVHICSMTFKSGLWEGQSSNTVTPSLTKLCCVAHDQWHGALLLWKKIFHPSLVCSSATGCIWHNSN